MRVLIYHNSNNIQDAFEGMRLRKNLKGALEEQGIPWVDGKYTNPEIAHFVSKKDMALLQRFSKNGSKTVVSAFYAEQDLGCSYLKQGKRGEMKLDKKGLAFMNEADLVIVPSLPVKRFCEENGVKTKLIVSPPPVNVERFNLSEMESRLFLRYFGVSSERRYVLITGNFYERKKISLLRGLAKALPKLRFYFFGVTKPGDEAIIRHYKVRATQNLKFSRIIGDDVYRSAMLHASGYLILSPLPNPITIMEAFAAKTPVIGFGNQSYNPLLIDGVTATMAKNEGELIEVLKGISQGREPNTTVTSFAIASKNTLARYGAMLKGQYENLLITAKPTEGETEQK